jgi:hypothetical protein
MARGRQVKGKHGRIGDIGLVEKEKVYHYQRDGRRQGDIDIDTETTAANMYLCRYTYI